MQIVNDNSRMIHLVFKALHSSREKQKIVRIDMKIVDIGTTFEKVHTCLTSSINVSIQAH